MIVLLEHMWILMFNLMMKSEAFSARSSTRLSQLLPFYSYHCEKSEVSRSPTEGQQAQLHDPSTQCVDGRLADSLKRISRFEVGGCLFSCIAQEVQQLANHLETIKIR